MGHLWKLAQKMPCENKFQAVLKSALFVKSLDHDLNPTVYQAICRKCCIPWQEGYFSVVVKPGRQQCWKQIEHYKRMGILTKQQKSLVEYLKTRTGRVAKYTCQICSFKTCVELDDKVSQPVGISTPLLKAKSRASKASKVSVNTPPGQKTNTNIQKQAKHLNKFSASKASIASVNTPKGQKTNAKNRESVSLIKRKPRNSFHPNDFRKIQQLLADKISAEAKAKISIQQGCR